MKLETPKTSPAHFESHHENGENIMCVQENGQCMVLIEMADLEPGQDEQFETATRNAFQTFDTFLRDNDFDVTTAELFAGLHIKIGDGLTESGGQAFAEENKIVFDRQKMAMSIEAAEEFLLSVGVLDPGDWTKALPGDHAKQLGSCLEYQLIHELFHIIDGQGGGSKYHRLSVDESPTKYGKEAEHECFAECSTHLVFGLPVSKTARETVMAVLRERAERIRAAQV